jgi:hypothetical protein
MSARQLLPHHAELVSASSISAEVASARGYRTVSTKSELKTLGFGEAQRRVPALLIPVWSVTGDIATYQIRPDEPRIKDGKPLKYETPIGARMTLDIPPAARSSLGNPSTPLFITEGARKADSAVTRGLCCVALLGVWNFRGTNDKGGLTALADWESIALKGRKVYIAFDSDVMEKDPVRQAMKRLRSFLALRGAVVRLIYLPSGEGGAKVGLDDYFAAGGTVDGLMRLATTDLSGDDEQEAKPARRSQATILIELATDAELFHSPDGDAYATVRCGEHLETWLLKARGFRDWLARRFHHSEGSAPSSQALQDALDVLSGKARFEGATRDVHTRIAEHEGAIYLDLCDDLWRAVEVDNYGWRIVNNPPVKFRRARGMLALPEPNRGGTINSLCDYVNVSSCDWVLIVCWLVAAYRPGKPFPLLALHGEQGSAKSTTARVLRSLVDPNKADLRSEPREERDLMIAAKNGWLIALDNLSRIHTWLSDALCRLATGGGFATRELYANDEEVLFDAKRPILLNGIEELATRSDLLERAIVLNLPMIPEHKRKTEARFWREFDAARPFILGALLDAVSGALRDHDNVKLERLPRMADFAQWATSAETHLGLNRGAFMAAYTGNRADSNDLALEASPVAAAVLSFVEAEESWSGTPSDLLKLLIQRTSEDVQRQQGFPKAANSLSGILKRLAPNLRAAGVNITRPNRSGKKGARLIQLERINIRPSEASEASAVSNMQTDSLRSSDDISDGLNTSDDGARDWRESSANENTPKSARSVDADDADGLPQGFSNRVAEYEADEEELIYEREERAAIMAEGIGL